MMKSYIQAVIPIFFIGLVLIASGCKKEKTDPVITWEDPVDILYGTLLDSAQLNATANIPGIFVYTPPEGTKLEKGENQHLKVDFTPVEIGTYNTVSKTVVINVTDQIYRNLNNILIGPHEVPPRYETEIFNLDFDNDDTIDITITSYSRIVYHYSDEIYVSISSSNGYEVKTSNIPVTTWQVYGNPYDTNYIFDTVPVPFIYNEQDIISMDDGSWKDSTLIIYAWTPGDIEQGHMSNSEINTWLDIGYKYIALRNIAEHKLVWLKIKVTGYSSVMLSGYKVYMDKNEITIE